MRIVKLPRFASLLVKRGSLVRLEDVGRHEAESRDNDEWRDQIEVHFVWKNY